MNDFQLRLLANRTPADPDALPLSGLEPMTDDEVRALQEATLRRHMKSQGAPDADVDAYLLQSAPPTD